MEKPIRSLVKAISWRAVATLTTMFLVFVFTGSIITSGGVGVGELILKTLIYYLHERIWNRIDFGRKRNQSCL
ncbi:MAG: DUF2061 domain-containing protein [Candidatus Bathyarchaeia archaeon]